MRSMRYLKQHATTAALALALIIGMAVGPIWVFAQSNQIVSTGAGTLTTSKPFVGTQTWNAAGVSFEGLKLNITETASAAGSNYLVINGGAAGTTAEFVVNKGGAVNALGAITSQATTNQLVLGVTNTVTITSPAPAASRTYTVPDAGAAATFGLFKSQPTTLPNPPQASYVTAQYTNATTTLSDVPGLAIPVLANTNYNIICHLLYQSTTGGAGNDAKVQVTGPAAPTAVSVEWTHALTTGTFFNATATAFSSLMDPNGAPTGATNFGDTIRIGLINGVNAGTVQV